MNLAYKYRFCIWLVDTLIREPLTFDEISDRWNSAAANQENSSLAERTFNRYKKDAEIMMDVTIVCEKSNGYRYRVVESELDMQTRASEWMLSAFRISNLTKSIENKERVVLESLPLATHLLAPISEAIDNEYYIRFSYKSHYHENFYTVELIPAFVRLYKQRWYVVGKLKDKEQAKTFAFERIDTLEVIEEKTVLSKSWQEELSPSEYFNHCFGIIRQHDPIKIGFRAFFPQDAYIKDIPIHSSQKVIHSCEYYTDFEVFLRPTYDLKQEFMWHRDKLAVLSPESFREDMIEILKATLKSYETGEFYGVDE